MEKLCTSKIFLKMAVGRVLTSHPTPLDPPWPCGEGAYLSSYPPRSALAMWGGCLPLILPPWIRPGHMLQKLSKESGIFQSLGIISIVLFY